MTKIHIYEVGPRDGFQNIKDYIPAETKLKIISALIRAGISHLQLTSFVSPKAIPQMQDAAQITETCLANYPGVDFFALVPNLRGAAIAWSLGLRKISYVVSLSKSHNQANINRTHEESLHELINIRQSYPELEICLDLATAFGCPFEGKVPPEAVAEFISPYQESGITEANLCDTIGIAHPLQIRQVIQAVNKAFPALSLQVHIHDTRNMGMVNTLAAIEQGVNRVQSTLGGLGGCPFAPGASGNLSTEDLVYMLQEMGYDTGIDFSLLLKAAKSQKALLPQGIFSGHHINI